MSPSTDHLAALAVDAYRTHPREAWPEGVEIDGSTYEVLHQESNGPAGYQGTIYQRKDTGEIIVAHRGTEFDRELIKDGVITDGGMVVAGVNAQERAAMALTERAIEIARTQNESRCQVPSITATGHSLGGTLAQVTGHRFGLRAETFNAYGAAGLAADLPRSDPDIVNHVRATDMVSAASAHVGEVRIYAVQADIDALERRGYQNGARFPDLRNPLGVALGDGFGAHYGDNFLASGPHGRSIINADDRARAEGNADMVADYRRDVARLHGVLALPRNVVDGVGDAGGRLLGRARPDPAPAPAFDAGSCAVPRAPAVDPRDRAHPDHALHEQVRRGVHAIDARLGRAPDDASERLAAGLTVAARANGLTRVDHVVLSDATPHAPAGANAFAVQGQPGDAGHRRAAIATQAALDTPVEQSFAALQAQRDAVVMSPAAVVQQAPAFVPGR